MYVGLNNDVQFLQFAFFDPAEDIIQRNLSGLLLFRLGFGNTFLCYAAGNLFLCRIQDITGLRNFVQTQNFYRCGRTCLADFLPPIIDQGPDTSVGRSGDDIITDGQRAALYQYGSYRATAFIQLGFYDSAMSRQLRIGFQFFDFRDQQNHFQ